MADSWGFVRKGSDAKAYQDYLSAGINGMLLNSQDPYLNQAYQGAQQNNMHTGLWVPAATGADPIAYAHQMAALAAKYHPELLVPNVEFQGKGYKGSPGWDWSEKMMAEFRRLSPDQKLAVSVMGNQDDFNYEAYTNRGADVWAQAYDGNMNAWDPDKLYNQLVKRGVDPSKINISLAPGGHAGTAGGSYSAYALDDFKRSQLTGLGLKNMAPVASAVRSAVPRLSQVGGAADPTRLALLRTIAMQRR